MITPDELDFCLLHGYEHMKSVIGNPIAYCEACEPKEVGYADSLRQQAKWIEEALDPATPETQRIDLGDVDVDELRAAADEIDRLRSVLEGLSHIHDGNPSDELAGLTPLQYAQHMLSEVRHAAREALTGSK